MEERIAEELKILSGYHPELEFQENAGRWVLIPDYELPEGWSQRSTDVAFTIKPGYPNAQPYGIYIPAGLQYDGNEPTKLNKSPSPSPPFEGRWWLLSWQPAPGEWQPSADLRKGSNLLNWVLGFRKRFEGGR